MTVLCYRSFVVMRLHLKAVLKHRKEKKKKKKKENQMFSAIGSNA